MTTDQSLSRAREAEDQVREKPRQLGLPGFAYVSHVAFIVVGYDQAVVDRARETLQARSGLPAKRLVSCG